MDGVSSFSLTSTSSSAFSYSNEISDTSNRVLEDKEDQTKGIKNSDADILTNFSKSDKFWPISSNQKHLNESKVYFDLFILILFYKICLSK